MNIHTRTHGEGPDIHIHEKQTYIHILTAWDLEDQYPICISMKYTYRHIDMHTYTHTHGKVSFRTVPDMHIHETHIQTYIHAHIHTYSRQGVFQNSTRYAYP